jgi:Spy/CpxP family protein refolding chaperone
MREVMTSMREKIKNVLTEEQQQKLQAAMSRGAAGGAAGRGNMLERFQQAMQDLGLTDEQKTQVKALFEEYRPKFQAIRQEANGDPKAAMEKARPLLQEFRDKLNGILTPEQAAKLKEKVEQVREQAGGARPAGKRKGGGDKPNNDQ